MREMERANESGARRVLATKRERRGDKDGGLYTEYRISMRSIDPRMSLGSG